MATRAVAGQCPQPPGSAMLGVTPRQAVGKANAAIDGCALQAQRVTTHLPRHSPPEKVSMREGLLKGDSISQKSLLGSFTPPSWWAAQAGHHAQPCRSQEHGGAAQEQHGPFSGLRGAAAPPCACRWVRRGACGDAAKTQMVTYQEGKALQASEAI